LQISDFEVIDKELKSLPISQSNIDKIDDLQKIIKSISVNYPDIIILVNIFGDADFLYHEKIGFTIYEEGFSYPIARGGRYIINDGIPAVGATIYINNLRKILVKTPKKIKKIILLPNNFDRKEAAKIRSSGYITINSLEEKLNQKQLLNRAKELGCNFVYMDDKAVPV
jgi:ATP phosphoribosyltransferase regulatory subunit